MENKKKKNIFTVIMLLFFIFFVALYFTEVTDLYQYNQYNKMSITKEAMQRFERDVEEGKDITISDYLETTKDYSNGISNLGYKTSNFITGFMSDGIRKTFKIIASFFA